MIKLKAVISQLDEKQYADLTSQLKENKAEKFKILLKGFRENTDEEELISKLEVNSSAYYTLKSRLFSKIQEFLTESVSGSKADLLRNISNIPNLLFNTPKDTAAAVLLKMEKDLLEFDMPYELTNVYNALKKLNLYSSKYYEYTQQYNKHVAYTVALDKSEDLLANFCKTMAEYLSSGDPMKLQLISIMKKEMANLSRLYHSHHLIVNQAILDTSVALFLPMPDDIADDEPIEDILQKAEVILKNYPKDISYQYLSNVISYLKFEYYRQINQPKKTIQYFELVNESLHSFLLYNFCSYPTPFLFSKLTRYSGEGKLDQLKEENEDLIKKYNPESSDLPNYINYNLFLAASCFYLKNYQESVNILNSLLNNISLKNLFHSELDIKLLLSFSYSMVNKYEQASTVIRSLTRKIRDAGNEKYENATVLIKMLKLQMDDGGMDKTEQKLLQLRNKFIQLNKGEVKILTFLDFGDPFIKILAKAIK